MAAFNPQLVAQQQPLPPAAPQIPVGPAKLSNGVTIQWGQPSAQAPAAPSGAAQLSNGVTIQWGQPSGGDVLSAPGDNPVSQAMSTRGAFNAAGLPYDDPTKLPKIGVTGIASLPRDPMLKAKYLASKLFPDYAPDQALRHMGFDGSRYYYIAPDGKAYYAEPTFSPMSAPGLTMKELPDTVASQFGPALPTVGGIAGGIAGGPDPASVATAALGGAAGESVRQMLANGLVGESQDFWSGRVPDVFKNGAEQGLNQAIGLGIGGVASKMVDRNPLRVAGYDVSSLTPQRIQEIESNVNLANSMGVNVTGGEAGKVRSLLANQRQLLRQPEAMTTLGDFYDNRNTVQLPNAFDRIMDQISTNPATAVANRDLGAAANSTIKSSLQARSAASRTFYDQAFTANPSVKTSELDGILATPAGSDALRGVITDLQNDRKLLASIPNGADQLKAMKAISTTNDPDALAKQPGLTMKVYDLVKQKLWDLEKGAEGENGKATFSSRSIGNLRTSLTDELDNADSTAVRDASGNITSPGAYSKARGTFEANSPPVTDLQKGIVGLVAKPKANALDSLPRVLFSAQSSDPYSIAQAKQAFSKAGKMDEWNAGVRAFLQNTWDAATTAGNRSDTGPAKYFWDQVAGNPKQVANLKAALGGAQFQAMDDFMKVAKMVRNGVKYGGEGSPTATDALSRGKLVGPVAGGFSKAIRGLDPFNIPNDIAAKIADMSAGKNASKLADLITTPQAVRSLRQLRVMRPGTKQFIQEIGNLATAMGWSAGAKAIGYGQQAPQDPGTIGAATQ